MSAVGRHAYVFHNTGTRHEEERAALSIDDPEPMVALTSAKEVVETLVRWRRPYSWRLLRSARAP